MKKYFQLVSLSLAILANACGAQETKSHVEAGTDPLSQPSLNLANAAPSNVFNVGTEVVTYSRTEDGILRSFPTKIYYPAASSGNDTPIATGKFPLVLFSHGLEGDYDTYYWPIAAMAQAGFIVAVPAYPNTKKESVWNYDDAWWGRQSSDASEVITKVLARGNMAGDKFYGHIDAEAGVGAFGHSLGGVTTNGLLGLRRDNRITSAVIYAGGSVANMSGPAVKVLIQHADNDDIESLPYWRAKQIYDEIPATWSKGFLTHLGGGHGAYLWPGAPTFNAAINTTVDWFRWSLYNDVAAMNRLPEDSQANGHSTWESKNVVDLHLEAESFSSNNGVYTEPCSEGGLNVGWIDNHDWMTWNVNIPSAGTYTIQYRVASPWDGGLIQFEKAGGYPIYGTLNVPYTGGWQSWKTISHRVSLPAGQQTIAIHALSGGFNLNWIKIVP